MGIQMNDFSDEKVRELKAVFALYDTDKDNFINIDEFDNAIKCLGYNLDQMELHSNFNEFAIEKRKISFESFERFIRKRSNDFDIDTELMECFRNIDKDGDGKIYPKDMKYLLLSLGEK